MCNTSLTDSIAMGTTCMMIPAWLAMLSMLLGGAIGEVGQGLGYLWFANPNASMSAVVC